MNILTTIHVLTVTTTKAEIAYQQVYVNAEKEANADYERKLLWLNDPLFKGWSVTLRKF